MTLIYLLYFPIICIYYNHLMLMYLLCLNGYTPSRYIQLISLTCSAFFIQNGLNYFFIYKKNQLLKIILKMIDKEQAYHYLYLYKSLEVFYMK